MACLPLCSFSECVSVLQQSQSVINTISETHLRGQPKPLVTSEPVQTVHWRDPAHSHLPEGQGMSLKPQFCLYAGVFTRMHIPVCSDMCMPEIMLGGRLLEAALTWARQPAVAMRTQNGLKAQ